MNKIDTDYYLLPKYLNGFESKVMEQDGGKLGVGENFVFLIGQAFSYVAPKTADELWEEEALKLADSQPAHQT